MKRDKTAGGDDQAEAPADPISGPTGMRRFWRPSWRPSWRSIPASLVRTRRGRAIAGLGATAVVLVMVVAVAAGPLAQHVPSPAPLESATAAPAGSSSETTAPTDTPGPRRTLDATAEPEPPDRTPGATAQAAGWPVDVEEYQGTVLVAPDGTIYIDGYAPLFPNGRTRADWPGLPGGSGWRAAAFGSDGTVYVNEWPTSEEADWYERLWALDAAGKPKAGWPLEIPMDRIVLAGPSGTVYVISPYGEDPDVLILGPDGKTRAKLSLPGAVCGQVLRPDGTLFLAVGGDFDPIKDAWADCKIRVFSPSGRETTRSSADTWKGLEMAEDGTVVAWTRELEPAGHAVAQTKLALLGTDGLPLAGWPVVFEGTAYPPAFGRDGSLYVTVLGLGTAPSRVEALDRNGASRPGWPVFYPAGYGPRLDGERPVIGAGGGIFLTAQNHGGQALILGLDANGAGLPGWPYQVPKPFVEFDDLQFQVMVGSLIFPNPTPIFIPNASGGLLYLVLEDRIVALDGAGKVAPGWPYVPRVDGIVWSALAPLPDGGIVVVYQVINETDEDVTPPPQARCFTTSGQAPK